MPDSTIRRRSGIVSALHSGDRMSRRDFHEIYRKMPDSFQAELISGIVYVRSPVTAAHGEKTALLNTLLGLYAMQTPGLQTCANATVFLADDSEPQPDALLRISPEHGGQSRTSHDGFVVGPPELVAEVAYSSRSIDLGAKREDYLRYGVRDYLVASLQDNKLLWFDLTRDRELRADPDGVI